MYCRELQGIAEYYKVLQSITEYCRVLQSIVEYYRVMQSIAEYCRALQSIAECKTQKVRRFLSPGQLVVSFDCFRLERKILSEHGGVYMKGDAYF